MPFFFTGKVRIISLHIIKTLILFIHQLEYTKKDQPLDSFTKHCPNSRKHYQVQPLASCTHHCINKGWTVGNTMKTKLDGLTYTGQTFNSWIYTVQPLDSCIYTVQLSDSWAYTVQPLDRWTYTVQPLDHCTYTVQQSISWTNTAFTLECCSLI